MTVRSQQIASGVVAAGSTHTTVFTVPSGYRLIVKELMLQLGGSMDADTLASCWADTSTYLFGLAYHTPQVHGTVLRDERWTVIDEGQLLRMYCTQAGVLYFGISGALLAL